MDWPDGYCVRPGTRSASPTLLALLIIHVQHVVSVCLQLGPALWMILQHYTPIANARLLGSARLLAATQARPAIRIGRLPATADISIGIFLDRAHTKTACGAQQDGIPCESPVTSTPAHSCFASSCMTPLSLQLSSCTTTRMPRLWTGHFDATNYLIWMHQSSACWGGAVLEHAWVEYKMTKAAARV